MAPSSAHFQNTQNIKLKPHNGVYPSDTPPSNKSTPISCSTLRYPISLSQTYFQNARDFQVHNGQFMNVAHATIVNDNTDNDSVSTKLLPSIATGAIFDSAERYPPGKCHPGTRQKIIESITNWINDPNVTRQVLWLYGPAGSGKSALAHSICELLRVQPSQERYGASFFFSRGSTDRGNALKLFNTLSYQLAVHFPSVRSEINHALSRDPSLPTKSMETQLHSLIIEPTLRCEVPLHSVTIIIDGLDECGDDGDVDTQRDIINLISKSVVEYTLPFRFMVVSRPEYWIRDTFEASPLPSITLSISLRDDVDADMDIKSYLTDEFEKIRLQNKRLMGSVAAPWPPTNIIDRFVYEASGQYIYASTILKFVGKSSRFSNPQEQLRVITTPSPRRASAFSELDRLYLTILSAYPRSETMKRVLGGLVVKANASIITMALGVETNEVDLVLDALSSLIDLKKPKALCEEELGLQSIFGSLLAGQDEVSFCHLSFREFLEDESRSGEFHIDIDEVRDRIVGSFFDMIHRNLDQNYDKEPHLFLNIDLATYHGKMRDVAFECIQYCGIDTLLPLITHMTDRLLHFDSSRWMKYLSCFVKDMEALGLLEQPLCQAKDRGHMAAGAKLDELRVACKKLGNTATAAQTRAISSLPLSRKFEITPIVVFLTEFYAQTYLFSLTRLSTGLGAKSNGMTSAIRSHSHVISLSYPHPKNDLRGWSLRGVKLNALFENHSIPDWATEARWRDQRIRLACQFLKSIFRLNSNSFFAEINLIGECNVLRTCIFDSRAMPDICAGICYSQNTCNCLSFLLLITDVQAWASLLSRQPHPHALQTFITSVLCWFNKQLTNPQTLKLLEDHAQDLPSRMAISMKHLFKNGLLPFFGDSYKKPLHAVEEPSSLGHYARSMTLRALPLHQGFYVEQNPSYTPILDDTTLPWHWEYWQTFHDEMFGKMGRRIQGSRNSIIDRSQWHPHLASVLLNVLVKFLYGRVYPTFSIPYSATFGDSPFLYITECLPYAQPTVENLEALRAIVYLYPQATPRWRPPEGFWLLLGQLLQKYQSSVLSSDELGLFESWLYTQIIQISIDT